MKKEFLNKMIIRLRLCIVALLLVILSLFLFSFKMQKLKEDFLNQLGISKTEADRKITGSILAGSLDYYGISKLKNILVNNRAGIVKDLAVYTKQYVNSEAFKKEYAALRESNKPAPAQKVETPEEMRASMIKMAKEFVQNSEESLKKAGPDMKKIFEQTVEAAKKNLREAEDPGNSMIKTYAENYQLMKDMVQQSNDNNIKQWEANYPVNHLLYVKVKLQAFLDATDGIDFKAQLIEKNGKKYFADQQYERKGSRWKLAFRAGKEAVDAARAFARQWMDEIN